MGKLILCAGKRAKTPYLMQMGNIALYSIEELCYYLYHNVYAVKEELFSKELIAWIRTELELPILADKLHLLVEQNYSVKDRIVTVLCNCDYYSEKEVRGIIKILDEIDLLSDEQRACMKADNYLKYGRYAKAAAIYEMIIRSNQAMQRLEKSEQGKVFHNLAVAYINIASYKEAADCFEKAYQEGGEEESLKQYLFALKLAGMNERYTDALASYDVTQEKKRSYERELGRYMMDADDYIECKAVLKLRNLRQQGRVSDYYNGIDAVIAHWKDNYLLGMEM